MTVSLSFMWLLLIWESFHFMWTYGVIKTTKPTEDQYNKRLAIGAVVAAIHLGIVMYVLALLSKV